MRRFQPVSPERLAPDLVAALLARHTGAHPLRVAFDGPQYADASSVARACVALLHEAGRAAALIDARSFYRDSSLRFEHGKTDVESFYTGWLDTAALEREVLRSVATRGTYLPALRDPDTNRSTRDAARALENRGVLIVVGELLLGAGLSFDVVVHFDLSRQARRRRSPADLAWTLPAFDRYDVEVDPLSVADLIVRCDDPRRPALGTSRTH